MSDQGHAFLETVLKARSVKEINELSPYAIRLAQRWAKESPGKTRELESAEVKRLALTEGHTDAAAYQDAKTPYLIDLAQRIHV